MMLEAVLKDSPYRLLPFDISSLPQALFASFETLSQDRYMKPGNTYRFRAFSQGLLVGHEIYWQEDCDFIQSPSLNAYMGGVSRVFDPLSAATRGAVQQLVTAIPCFEPGGQQKLELGCHQIRITVSEEDIGRPAPEGFHRDGFEHLLIVSLAAKNIYGGLTLLRPVGQRAATELFNCELEPGAALLIDDQSLGHYTTPITHKIPGNGFRDVMVIMLTWKPGSPFPIDELRRSVTSNTKLLILNSPSNPIGSAISPREWHEVHELCSARGVRVLNEEEYLTGFKQSVASLASDSNLVSGLSKVFGLPALRIGWAVCDKSTIEKMVNYKRYTSVSNSLLCENISIAALDNAPGNIARYNEYLTSGLTQLMSFSEQYKDSLTLITAQNTPFVWFNLNLPMTSMAFAERLLAEERLLVMPAEVFGYTQGIRVTYARDAAQLQEGFKRIGNLLDSVAYK